MYAKSKEKVLFYPYSSLFLEYKLKIQSIGVHVKWFIFLHSFLYTIKFKM